MFDPELAARIRGIFLHHETRVTVGAAARLLGWSRAEMTEAIDSGEMYAIDTCSGVEMVELRDLASYAAHEWPMHVIEKALGREASQILPPGLRTRNLTVRLPLIHIRLLEVLADEARQSVTKFLELMCDELAGNEKERLAGLLPGIVEAYHWPHEVPAQRLVATATGGGLTCDRTA